MGKRANLTITLLDEMEEGKQELPSHLVLVVCHHCIRHQLDGYQLDGIGYKAGLLFDTASHKIFEEEQASEEKY